MKPLLISIISALVTLSVFLGVQVVRGTAQNDYLKSTILEIIEVEEMDDTSQSMKIASLTLQNEHATLVIERTRNNDFPSSRVRSLEFEVYRKSRRIEMQRAQKKTQFKWESYRIQAGLPPR